MYVCVPEWVYVHHTYAGDLTGPKRVWGPLELKLQAAASRHVSDGNETFAKTSGAFNVEPSPSLCRVFVCFPHINVTSF